MLSKHSYDTPVDKSAIIALRSIIYTQNRLQTDK